MPKTVKDAGHSKPDRVSRREKRVRQRAERSRRPGRQVIGKCKVQSKRKKRPSAIRSLPEDGRGVLEPCICAQSCSYTIHGAMPTPALNTRTCRKCRKWDSARPRRELRVDVWRDNLKKLPLLESATTAELKDGNTRRTTGPLPKESGEHAHSWRARGGGDHGRNSGQSDIKFSSVQ